MRRPNIVQSARPLKFYFAFFSLVAVVACCFSSTPSHVNAQKKNSGSSGKGFGKNNIVDGDDAKTKAEFATIATASPEKQYLDPFALEITSTTSNDNDNEYNGERQVRSLTDRSPGDILLEIPSEDIITVKRIRSRLGAYCKTNGNGNDSGSYNGEENDINTNENDDQEEALALGLLRLKHETLDPYVSNVLPMKHFNAWTLPRRLWKETKSVLPRCYSETFDATRQRVNKFAMKITAASSSNEFTIDDALWAFSMVRSRSLAVPELRNDNNDGENDRIPLALIPGLDLLNHKFGSGTELQLIIDDTDDDDDNSNNVNSNSKSKWVVSSSKSIKAGDEVFLSYGDDKDNWKLLLTYGFALPNNPNAVVFWSWRDLLDAAHVVRPATFTDAVCQQLMRHPQLEAYTVKSENRATFSYNAQTRTPRESLSNGLIMLNSLAAQLGKPEKETTGKGLENQVLVELRRRRLEELREGQSLLKDLQEVRKAQSNGSKQNEEYLEWKPFFDSLRSALEAELQQLV